MATLTAERTMLYCPKCQRKYEEGSQRFCNNDGGRLLPVVNSGTKREAQTKGVFTNLLGKTSRSNNTDEQLASTPRFVKSENIEPKIEKVSKNNVFKMEQELKPKISKPVTKPKPEQTPKANALAKPKPPANVPSKPQPKKPIRKKVESKRPSTTKPISRLIDPKEVKIDQAKTELERKGSSKTGVNKQNPRILIGQTIKGRYQILDLIYQDYSSVAFLAEDKIIQNRVCVRILMNKNEKEDFQNKLLSEERVSLSHINHPNVANVFDSGELTDGKPFIVSEYVENESVSEYLKKTGVFNPMRTARIVRQASYALSEVHQNGILHRNLHPKNLLLTVSEAGNETVKVTDFCVSDGKHSTDNFKYKSPEQLNGQLPTYASDSYSLAVIAFEMLTNRLPFSGKTAGEILKSQKAGLTIEASNLNPELNVLVDKIFAKALAFNPSDRYPKSRDFGEAIFNALTTSPPWENEKADSKAVDQDKLPEIEEKITLPSLPIGVSTEKELIKNSDITVEPSDISSDIHIDSNVSDLHIDSKDSEFEIEKDEGFDADIVEIEVEDQEKKPEVGKKDSLWQNRSPEPVREGGWKWTIISILGLLILTFGAFGIWQYFNSLEPTPSEILQADKELGSQKLPAQGVDSPEDTETEIVEDIESPPVPRDVETPKGFKYFENSKQNLNAELAKNYRGFTIAYPEDWKVKKFDKNKDKVDDKFLDIANESQGGIPIESLMISPYKSNGTFSDDEKLFPKLVEKSNEDISKSLSGNYEVVSEGNTTIQNGRWKAYQVNFRTKESGEVNGKKIELWGRRLWIPVQRPGVNTGFIITMFATSLSDEVKSADDVGKKGELAEILQTFEPEQNY